MTNLQFLIEHPNFIENNREGMFKYSWNEDGKEVEAKLRLKKESYLMCQISEKENENEKNKKLKDAPRWFKELVIRVEEELFLTKK